MNLEYHFHLRINPTNSTTYIASFRANCCRRWKWIGVFTKTKNWNMHRGSCPQWMVAGIIIWLVIFTGLRSSDRPHPKIGKNQTKAKVPSHEWTCQCHIKPSYVSLFFFSLSFFPPLADSSDTCAKIHFYGFMLCYATLQYIYIGLCM